MRTRALWVAVLLALPAAASAQFLTPGGKGATTAEFLELGVGARAVAMGQAYSAAADDATSLYWNPASMVNVEHRAATFMHAPYVASSYFDYAGYVQNMGALGAFGAGLQYYSAGTLSSFDGNGAPTGSFSPYDLALSFGYARQIDELPDFPYLNLLEGFSVGASMKYVQERVVTSAQTEALDLGVLSPYFLSDSLRLAFTATNIGGTLKFDSAGGNLPMAFRFGSSYIITGRWLATADWAIPRGETAFLAFGTEYRFPIQDKTSFCGRLGYDTQTSSDLGIFSGLSVGLGFGFKRWDVDYAFVPLGALGLTQRLSLGARF